ncbi:MAG: WD40/YVTN/BNR-like repeat-containing protein [bacterium]
METPPLLIGTGGGLFRLGGTIERELPNRVVSAVAVREGTAWAILDERELWRQERGGRWEAVAEALGRKATCLLPAAPGVLVGTDEAYLLRLHGTSLGPVASFDLIEGREAWFTPWGGPPATRSLTEGPTGTLFANIHVGGVARSTDGGKSWRPTMDIGADVHQVLAHPEDASIVLAAAAIGLGMSTDGGETWTFRRAGLHATYQRAVAVSGDRVLVSTAQSERGRQSAVYRLDLGKRLHFEKCDDGLPTWFSDNIDTYCLAAQGEVAVIGDPNGSLFVSPDGGETWELREKDLPRIRCVAFA